MIARRQLTDDELSFIVNAMHAAKAIYEQCRDNEANPQGIRDTFARQIEQATKWAETFEQADEVTIVTRE